MSARDDYEGGYGVQWEDMADEIDRLRVGGVWLAYVWTDFEGFDPVLPFATEAEAVAHIDRYTERSDSFPGVQFVKFGDELQAP